MCGQDGAFDGQGKWPDEYERVRFGVTKTYSVVWEQFRCPECNATFQVRTEAELEDMEETAI